MKKVRGMRGWAHEKHGRSEYTYYNNKYVGTAFDYISMLEYIKYGMTDWINLSDYGIKLNWHGIENL